MKEKWVWARAPSSDEEKVSPSHNEATKVSVISFTKGFGHDISPVIMSVHFGNLDVSSLDLVAKMMPFQTQVFSSGLGAVTVGQDNAGSISFKDF